MIGHCVLCAGPCRMPSWILTAGGGYANNPDKQRFAIARGHTPVTTPAERAAAKSFYDAQSPELKALCEKIRAERFGRVDG